MASEPRITGYHAHVYFDAATREPARRLREGLAARFPVTLGRWFEQPVGPHPRWMYQVVFAPEQFGALVPYLALNRHGLDILVHPETGDDLADHTAHALWLGRPVDLDLKVLRHT